jgi:hypothetical protein
MMVDLVAGAQIDSGEALLVAPRRCSTVPQVGRASMRASLPAQESELAEQRGEAEKRRKHGWCS